MSSKKVLHSCANQLSYKDLQVLDGLRGLTAAYVMIGHARWLLWEGYTEGFLTHPDMYGTFNKLLMYFFSMFNHGHSAVLFFFVLSGFVIHLKYAAKLYDNNQTAFEFWGYLKRRLIRIYIPLIFALIITFTLDTIGHSLGYSIYFQQTPNAIINQNIKYNIDLSTLLGNLAFLTNVYVPVFGSNGPLWALMYTWWFYMVYPLLYLINRKTKIGSFIIVFILFLLSFCPDIWPAKLLMAVFSYLFSFWLGAFMADVYVKRIMISYNILAICLIFIPLSLILKLSDNGVITDTFWAMGFVGLIALIFRLQQKGWRFALLKKLKWLGDFSFTLYVVHFPILVILSGWLLKANSNKLPVTFEYVTIGIFITLVFAYFSHFITERPFVKRNRN